MSRKNHAHALAWASSFVLMIPMPNVSEMSRNTADAYAIQLLLMATVVIVNYHVHYLHAVLDDGSLQEKQQFRIERKVVVLAIISGIVINSFHNRLILVYCGWARVAPATTAFNGFNLTV